MCVNINDLMYCPRALSLCVPALCGPSHDQFLWQHDFENSFPLQRPTAVVSCSGCSPLLMHDSFIAHYHPTLISSQPGSPCLVIRWGWSCGGRGSSYYKASVSMLRLASGIHLICCDCYRVHPLYSSPSLWLPQQHPPYTTLCCLCSRENISSAQGGED